MFDLLTGVKVIQMTLFPKPKTHVQVIQSDLSDAILDLHNQQLRAELATSMVTMLTSRVERLKTALETAKTVDDPTLLEHSHRQL